MDSFVTMYPRYCSTEDHAEMAHYIYFAISALVTVRGMTSYGPCGSCIGILGTELGHRSGVEEVCCLSTLAFHC